MKKIYILILTGLVLLRLVNLNQSLWLDEAITAQKSKTLGWTELIGSYSVADFHPPLHYFVTKIFADVFGYNEFGLRLPSILACVLAAFFVYKLGGRWASVLFLANPLVFYYSQEARMYMLACALLLGTWWGVKNKKWWANILAMLSLFTFYGSGFFLVAILFTYRKNWKYFLPGMLMAMLALAPLLQLQLKNSQVMLAEVKNWGLVLGKVEVKNLVLFPLKFFTGRVSFYPKIVYFILGGVWGFGLFILGMIRAKKQLLIIPILLAIIISIKAPMLLYFRYLYLVPVLCLGLARYSQKLKVIFLLGSLLWIMFYVLDSNQWREDWQGLSRSLEANSTILLPRNFAESINFYRNDVRTVDIREPQLEEMVYATDYGSEIMGINYMEQMKNLGYKIIAKKSFRKINLDTWKKI